MIKVVVAITTYNLEKYIEKALNSVLSQKTDYEYEIIVADDCSQDGTSEILMKYQRQYPEKIKVLLSDYNLGSLANSNRIFDGIECDYFSFLDGDDYWLDESHLQKQVDFLEKNRDYVLCAANTQYEKNGVLCDYVVPQEQTDKTYDFQDYLSGDIPFVHTSALMVRNVIFQDKYPECYYTKVGTFEECALRGEDFRRILHLEKGKMYVMNSTMSVYRIHDKGVWQSSTLAHRYIEAAISDIFFRTYFGEKYRAWYDIKVKNSYKAMMNYLSGDMGLLSGYHLPEKDTMLLTEYLLNLSKEKVNSEYSNRKSNVKKKIIYFLLKTVRFLEQ